MKDYFFLALTSLRQRKLRSWLTMLGIFIGIAAIVSLISLGQGLENMITEQFEEMGSDKLTILSKAGGMSGPMAGAISSTPLTIEDLRVVENTRGVDFVAAQLFSSVKAEYNDDIKNVLISGMPATEMKKMFEGMTSFEVEEGRDLENKDKYKVLIGNSVANKMFDDKVRIRDKIKLNGLEFKVVGILKVIGNPPDDHSFLVNIDTLRELVDEPELVSMIFVKIKNGFSPNEVAENVEKELRDFRDEKKGEETFSVSTSEQLLETFGNILGVVQAVLVGIAAISLLVGGIGIMNSMYTSVLERTKEIGIMKAIGAKNKDIMYLFIIESGLLGLAGGAVGILAGVGLSKLVEIIAVSHGITLLQASFPLSLIIGALAFSFVVGTISGILPAIQAFKLKPVDALRYE